MLIHLVLAQSWHRVPGKGCFYLDQDLVQGAEHEDVVPIKCHHYQLTLLQPSNVWLEVGVAEPGISGMDVLLFVCRVDDKEEVTDVITYTQHRVAKVTESVINRGKFHKQSLIQFNTITRGEAD